MTYELIYSPLAEKQLKKLDKNGQERVISVLERIRVRPLSFVKKLIGNNYFSVRAGKFRIILDIKKNKLVIFVVEVGHRKNIYRSLK